MRIKINMLSAAPQKKFSQLSLNSEYFIYSLVIISTIFIVLVFSYCSAYSLFLQEKNEQLYQVSENLHQAVDKLFDNDKALVKEASVTTATSMKVQQANEQLNKLSQPLGIHFAVFDEQCRTLFKSSHNNGQYFNPGTCEKISWNSNKNNGEFLAKSFGSDNNDYLYHRRLKSHPNIVILTSFDKVLLEKDLHRQFFPRVCELLLMGFFCIVVLYFFRRKIINPILILSQQAILISQGDTNTKIPKQNSFELFNLAKALVLVKHYIKRNEIYRKKLEEASEIIKNSAEAREDFVKSINKELMHPLKEILICTEILLKDSLEKNDSPSLAGVNIKCIEKIREAVSNIKSKTSSALNLAHFDINSIVNQAVQINHKPSYAKKINIKTALTENMPTLYGDALKIKQILVCLLSQSIENSTEGQEIMLRTNTFLHDEKKFIQIIIKDFGFGLSEDELDRIQKNVGWVNESGLFTNMEQSFIEKVIKLHHGSFVSENKIHEGRTIYLKFPIDVENTNESELENHNIYYLPSK